MYRPYSKGLAMTMSTTTENDALPMDAQSPPSRRATPPPGPGISLAERTYQRRLMAQVEHLKVPFATSSFIALASALFFVLLVLGIFRPYIEFQQDGLLTLPTDVDRRETEFSIASTMRAFSSNARFSGSPAIRLASGLLSTLLLAFVVIVPAVEYTCLLLLWFYGSSSSFFNQLKATADWCAVFGYMEIFALSVVIATYHITMVVQFLIGTNCEAASGFIGLAVEFGLIEHEDAFCYNVVGHIREGVLCLLMAAVLQSIFRTFVGEAIVSSAQQQERLVRGGFGGATAEAAAAEDPTLNATDHHELLTTPTAAGAAPPTRSNEDNSISFADRFRLLLLTI
jgi:hypothetical protein